MANQTANFDYGLENTAILKRAVAGLLRQADVVCKALRHRQEIAQLADYDEALLKDIGLNQSDIEDALREPFYRDPSEALARHVRHAA